MVGWWPVAIAFVGVTRRELAPYHVDLSALLYLAAVIIWLSTLGITGTVAWVAGLALQRRGADCSQGKRRGRGLLCGVAVLTAILVLYVLLKQVE